MKKNYLKVFVTASELTLTASPWRTGGDHQDDLILRGWRLSSRTWNPI